jgi:methyl-accepting chemotaxis protein
MVFVFVLSIFFTIQIISYIDVDVKNIKHEQAGLLYEKKLFSLLLSVQTTRGMSNAYLNGKTELATKIEEEKSVSNRILQSLNSLESEYGEILQIRRSLDTLQSDIENINRIGLNQKSKTTFTAYTNIVESILTNMNDIADNTHLTIDENLVDNYLIRMMVLKIPEIIESLGRSRGLGSGIAAKQTINESQQTALKLFLQSISVNKTSIERAFSVLYRKDSHLEVEFSTVNKDAMDALENFITATEDELLNASSIRIGSTNYFSKGSQTIGAFKALHHKIEQKLSNDMEIHVESMETERLSETLLIAVLVLILLYLFIGFYLSVNGSIQILTSTLKAAEDNQDLTQDINLVSEDEMKLIANSINTLYPS